MLSRMCVFNCCVANPQIYTMHIKDLIHLQRKVLLYLAFLELAAALSGLKRI